jgi:hypothetical protein
VPRKTLNDRLRNYPDPTKKPKVGRPQKLSVEEEKAILGYLCLCSELKYPIRTRKLCAGEVEGRQPGKDCMRNLRVGNTA